MWEGGQELEGGRSSCLLHVCSIGYPPILCGNIIQLSLLSPLSFTSCIFVTVLYNTIQYAVQYNYCPVSIQLHGECFVVPSTLITHSLQSWNIKLQQQQITVIIACWFLSPQDLTSLQETVWADVHVTGRARQPNTHPVFERAAVHSFSQKKGKHRKVLCRPPLEVSHRLVVTSSLFCFPFRRCEVYVQTS